MNSSLAKDIRKYLKEQGYDLNTKEGREIYKNVKQKLKNNKIETILAGKKKR